MEGSSKALNMFLLDTRLGGINKFQPRWIGGIVRLCTTFIGGINEKTVENSPNLLDPRLP